MALAVFRVCTGSRAGQRLKVPAWPLVVGRAETCDLRLNNDQVSRLHCELRLEPAGIVVRDMRSRNGTFVNGVRIDAAALLAVGDRLRIGGLEIELVESPDVETSIANQPTADAARPVADPNRMTLDELVRFDDEPLRLESDEKDAAQADEVQPATASSLGAFATTIIDPMAVDASPPRAPAAKKPAETPVPSDAARNALKQLFRGRS